MIAVRVDKENVVGEKLKLQRRMDVKTVPLDSIRMDWDKPIVRTVRLGNGLLREGRQHVHQVVLKDITVRVMVLNVIVKLENMEMCMDSQHARHVE